MSERILVTSALPYANGSPHLGHLVEYIQTDIYVRFRRACGDDVTYVCAADAHGTPIEVNAAKAGVAPRDFVEKYRKEHHEGYRAFGVEFSTFYTTDSPENAKWAYRVYDALKAKGLIYKKSVEQLYCETDRRFLPDRFVKGTCPKCGTPDQYGDVCEHCGTTYDPRELKQPYCAICRTPPVVRASDHAYVDLKRPEVKGIIEGWVNAEGHLEPAVREQVKGWLADLQDWCITRDEPYFGFPVKDPEFKGKYLYVWVDAPIGYLSSAEHYFAAEAPTHERLAPAEFERRYLAEGAPTRLEHFIGKDILRFHAVFWPAMLWATGLKRPDRMPVHGHLTVNGEKMSKSRGTFVTASTYLESGLDPELLRYYYASNLSPGIYDLDLALEEFRNRVNADLVKRIANLASRVHALVAKAGGELARPAAPAGGELAAATARALAQARPAFRELEYRAALRAANDLADLGNKALQDQKPWERLEAEGARALLYDLTKALHGLAVMLAPVLPRFAAGLAEALGGVSLAWPEGFTPFDGQPARFTAKPPQIQPVDAKQVAKLIVSLPDAPAPKVAKAQSPAETASKATVKPAASAGAAGAPAFGVIQYDDFAKVELRVGEVQAAEAVPKADKLLKLTVDVGEPAPRTIVAGIAQAYPDPSALVGRRIVVVANLAPRPLRGITSQGMLLAAGEPPDLQVVTVGKGIPAGTRVK
ncbi:methionine--tRNA ligase [Anaeromyxobacter diazotrophicus]|uniref:Methionine--tRNA ligase n=1 Tax=Anaeromyxobacter diazotrophicus TaxID=2590199 RepID=A0A7I9VSF3_9BACT|nr:methionine--tRNA ligase [Anaeromyxobacter diazotrophicus]GEJ59148.1 methionine--tRNA ligase [Anaeromyxobacter diazotrophicus]